jgi:hypothetical protein
MERRLALVRAFRLALAFLAGLGAAIVVASSHARVLVVTDTVVRGFNVGHTVTLAKRTQTSKCTLGANPDHQCSPGVYYSKLTKAVICKPGFHTTQVREVPDADKREVQAAYGLGPQSYWPAIEIDHIVSLELGGSNDISNLYPEKADAKPAGYHVKDKLENKLHDLVCAGQMTLRTVQKKIAANWQALYKQVYGVAPTK